MEKLLFNATTQTSWKQKLTISYCIHFFLFLSPSKTARDGNDCDDGGGGDGGKKAILCFIQTR